MYTEGARRLLLSTPCTPTAISRHPLLTTAFSLGLYHACMQHAPDYMLKVVGEKTINGIEQRYLLL